MQCCLVGSFSRHASAHAAVNLSKAAPVDFLQLPPTPSGAPLLAQILNNKMLWQPCADPLLTSSERILSTSASSAPSSCSFADIYVRATGWRFKPEQHIDSLFLLRPQTPAAEAGISLARTCLHLRCIQACTSQADEQLAVAKGERGKDTSPVTTEHCWQV